MNLNTVSPEGASIWYYCNGSQVMQQDESHKESERTMENKACHIVAKKILNSYAAFQTPPLMANDFVDKEMYENIMVDQEMYEGAQMYVMDILKYCNQSGLIRFVKTEDELSLDNIYPGMKGTPDAWIYNPEALELIIWGLEYDYGFIDVFENPKLLIYVKGILDSLNIDGLSDQSLTVRMRIVQPRSFGYGSQIREWVINASDLRPYFNSLSNAAAVTTGGKGTLNPGLNCHYCKARYKCEALGKTVYNGIDVITGIVPMNLEGNDLAVQLKLLRRISELLKYQLSAIETQVKMSFTGGNPIPGFKSEQGYGRKRWRKDTSISEVLMMGDAMGIELRKPENLDTPSQAVVKFTKMAKKMDVDLDDLVKQYFETPKTSLKIIEGDGKLAKQVFG